MKIHVALPLIAAGALLAGADAGADTDAGADADAGAVAATGEELPFLGPVPQERSKPPTIAEWDAAKDISAPGLAGYCWLRRVREWLRARCEVRPGNTIDLVAGKSADVYFSVKIGGGLCVPDEQEGQICWDLMEAVFPLRRGDRRLFQWTLKGFSSSYGGLTGDGETFLVLSEVWLDDEPGPTVAMAKTRL